MCCIAIASVSIVSVLEYTLKEDADTRPRAPELLWSQTSLFIAPSNSSHTLVFASVTTWAIACLAFRYLPPASGVPWANQAWKTSFFSLSASYHWCPLADLKVASTTGTGSSHLTAVGFLNMAHSDSMSPTSDGINEKLFWRWELKLSWTGASVSHSQFTITTHLGLPGLTGSLPHSPAGGDQSTALHLSLPQCPRHTSTDWKIWLQSQSSTCGLR